MAGEGRGGGGEATSPVELLPTEMVDLVTRLIAMVDRDGVSMKKRASMRPRRIKVCIFQPLARG